MRGPDALSRVCIQIVRRAMAPTLDAVVPARSQEDGPPCRRELER